MDDQQNRLAPSLQRQLIHALTWGIALVGLVSALLSLLSAYHEAGELQDELLHQTALALGRNANADAGAALSPKLADAQRQDTHGQDDDTEEAALIVQSMGSPTPLALPAGLADGLHDVQVQGRRYRVLVHRADHAKGLVIAQRADWRQEQALASALRTTLPLLFLLPVLVLLVSVRARQALRPLRALSQEVQQRKAQNLQALAPTDLPAELRPFVQAINTQLHRVDTAMQNQQRFVADAAHELRTPLTALSLQAEALAQTDLPTAAQPRLAALQAGLARQGALVAQLLDLARIQAGAAAIDQPATVALRGLLHHIVQDCLPLAQAKNIDLGVEASHDTALDSTLAIPEHELYILLKNLVDNALRYTPAGGRVDIRVQAGGNQGLCLAVADTGPGIAPEYRQQVLQPFYRLASQAESGSGLGLAIVAGIAQRWALPLRLDWNDAQQQQGLLVELLFAPQMLVKK
jgi:two-component system OmpR family sensor kinase